MSVEGVVLFVIDNRRASRRLKLAFRRDVRTVKQGLTRGDKLAGLYSIRQACPECGRPMRVLPDEPARGPLLHLRKMRRRPVARPYGATGRTGRCAHRRSEHGQHFDLTYEVIQA